MVLAAHIDEVGLGGDQVQVEMNNLFEYAMETNKVEESIQISDDPIGHDDDDEQFESNNFLKTHLQIFQMALSVINVTLWQRLKLA